MSVQIQRRTHQADDIVNLSGISSPLLARIYSARGVTRADDITHRLQQLHHYQSLKDIDQASAILAEAITQQQRILIVGDFDCDGATSSALGVLAIRAMGGTVDYLVPNRFEYGYGLTKDIVEVAAARRPDVLVTVDNGISSIEGVQAAKSRGWKVVVTDHHLAGSELPNADAIVNPNQLGCTFPGKNTAGVGVIFYLICALRTRLTESGWLSDRNAFNPCDLLDLVALGTVADVVTLDTNNRIFAQQGLNRIKAGRCRPGIRALVEVAGRDIDRLTASDMGFAVAPRLNAAGRLDDMSLGIELLLTNQLDRARTLAAELDQLNRERREIEQSMQEEALRHLATLQLDHQHNAPWGITLYRPDWHQGVLGILAARIRERTHRPVVAFAEGSSGELKGSARSVNGLHIRDALDAVSRNNPGLISKFGGHAMAAGLSISADRFPEFATAFEQTVRELLTADQLSTIIQTDGELSAGEMTLNTAVELRAAAPWGQHFPEPSFDGRFQVIQQRLVGGKHLKLVLKLPGHELYLDGIAFNIDLQQWPNFDATLVQIVYKLDINRYRQQDNLQLIVEHVQLTEASPHRQETAV